MGTRNPNRNFDFDDDLSFLGHLDVDEFESAHYEKVGRSAKARSRRHQRARNRFSDYEGERWLKQRANDWDDYEPDDDLFS